MPWILTGEVGGGGAEALVGREGVGGFACLLACWLVGSSTSSCTSNGVVRLGRVGLGWVELVAGLA